MPDDQSNFREDFFSFRGADALDTEQTRWELIRVPLGPFDLNVIFRGLGEDDSRKKLEAKNLF